MSSEHYVEMLGKNLKKFRESHGQTRQAFVNQYDGFVSTLQSYEAGKKGPNLKRFLHICNSLKISPNVLLEGLYPLKTEKDDLMALSALITELDGGKRQKVLYLQEMILRCLLDTPPQLNDKSFGERLHLLRIDAGLEVDELADQCTIAKSTLQGYESGQYDPSITVLLRLCEVFDVTPEYLLIADVKYPSYPDERYAFLRPRQIKSMLDITRSLIEYF